MKKKILIGIAAFAFIAAIGMNVKMNSKENPIAGLSLKNVEALASESGSSSGSNCYGSLSYSKELGDKYVKLKKYCGNDCKEYMKCHSYSKPC